MAPWRLLASGRRASFALLLASSLLPQQGAVEPHVLTQHSLTFPQVTGDANWFLGGSATWSSVSLVLNPGVFDRVGMAWNDLAVETNDFEVTAVVGAAVVEDFGAYHEYDGLALWYVHEGRSGAQFVNDKNERKRRKVNAGFGLFGYRGDYDGLGIFLYFDAGSPMMTMLVNDGAPNKISREDVLGNIEGLGLYSALVGPKAPGEITIRLRVEPHSVSLEVPGSGRLQLPAQLRAGGHLGFTALTARREKSDSGRPSRVELRELRVASYTPEELPPAVATSSVAKSEEEIVAPEQPPQELPPADVGKPEENALPEAPPQELPAALATSNVGKSEDVQPTAKQPAVDDAVRADIAALRQQTKELSEEVAALHRSIEALAAAKQEKIALADL